MLREQPLPGPWAEPKIGLDVSECGGDYIVHASLADVPGEGSVQVTVEGNLFTIRAESVSGVHPQLGSRNANSVVARSIALPSAVEPVPIRSCRSGGGFDITLRKAVEPVACTADQADPFCER
jgi:HSP20 family molecular chaperone IbpA